MKVSTVSAELAFAVRDSKAIWLKGHMVMLTYTERINSEVVLSETHVWVMN